MKIILRKEAKELGLKRYFTGKECKWGHVDERRTHNGECVECIHIQNNSEESKERKKQYYFDNKEARDNKNREWRDNNKVQVQKRQKDHYIRNQTKILEYQQRYRDNNKEKIAIRNKKYRENNDEMLKVKSAEWYQKNKDLIAIRDKPRRLLYNKLHPEIRIANTAKRRALKKSNTPINMSEDEKILIRQLYKDSRDLTKLTGIQFQVDHIVPITPREDSPYKSGQHCYMNLQIISASENQSKGNKIPDYNEKFDRFL
jgi:hypothetical protein